MEGNIWDDKFQVVKDGSRFDVYRWRIDIQQWSRYAEFDTEREAQGYVDRGGKDEHEITLQVSEREFHTILAALRLWQEIVNANHQEIDDWIGDIASDGGLVKPLDDQEIEELCDRINHK